MSGSISVRVVSRITFVLVVFSIGCVSASKTLVQNSTAAYLWFQHEYNRECVEVKGPPSCKERFLLLETLHEDVTVANEAMKIGKLPPSATKKLKALVKALEQ